MNLLFLTICFPLLGFLLLAFSQGRLCEKVAAIIGVGSIGLAALTAFWATIDFFSAQSMAIALANEAATKLPADQVALLTEKASNFGFYQALWTWFQVGNFKPVLGLYLDKYSVIMICTVTGVGFFIHLFASWYMRGEEGYSRFFAYMNLFVACMMILILGDDILFLYFGWEGVGLCSYLLIGFYYTAPKNGAAAMKAFIITRIGDVLMAIGMFIILWRTPQLTSLSVREIAANASLIVNDSTLTLATLLLFGGAIGKSAQIPLQTWLADAMAGPTPVSALIHAATMVTAGVYLLVRLQSIFAPAEVTMTVVGIIGAITLLMAGFCALVQTDIKRILAYSTMSQLGYMFLAVSVCAWNAALFHLMTHAFFKALLFLASGSVIISCHHEQNIFKMGGLAKKLPLAYLSFLIGGAALSALPFVTAGFYSKDEILAEVLMKGHLWLVVIGLIGAFMTSLYTFRLIFITFHGPTNMPDAHAGKGIAHNLPLAVLIVLSTIIGSQVVQRIFLGSSGEHHEGSTLLIIVSSIVAIAGIAASAALFLGKRTFVNQLSQTGIGKFFNQLWLNGWGFDAIYNLLFVKPYLFLTKLLVKDPCDKVIGLLPLLVRSGNRFASLAATGSLRWYAASLAIGAVVLIAIMIVTFISVA